MTMPPVVYESYSRAQRKTWIEAINEFLTYTLKTDVLELYISEPPFLLDFVNMFSCFGVKTYGVFFLNTL